MNCWRRESRFSQLFSMMWSRADVLGPLHVEILAFTDRASVIASLRSDFFFVVQIRLNHRTALPRTRRARFFRKRTGIRVSAAAFWPSHDVQIAATNRYQRDQSHERLANARCLGAKKTNIDRQHRRAAATDQKASPRRQERDEANSAERPYRRRPSAEVYKACGSPNRKAGAQGVGKAYEIVLADYITLPKTDRRVKIVRPIFLGCTRQVPKIEHVTKKYRGKSCRPQ